MKKTLIINIPVGMTAIKHYTLPCLENLSPKWPPSIPFPEDKGSTDNGHDRTVTYILHKNSIQLRTALQKIQNQGLN